MRSTRSSARRGMPSPTCRRLADADPSVSRLGRRTRAGMCPRRLPPPVAGWSEPTQEGSDISAPRAGAPRRPRPTRRPTASRAGGRAAAAPTPSAKPAADERLRPARALRTTATDQPLAGGPPVPAPAHETPCCTVRRAFLAIASPSFSAARSPPGAVAAAAVPERPRDHDDPPRNLATLSAHCASPRRPDPGRRAETREDMLLGRAAGDPSAGLRADPAHRLHVALPFRTWFLSPRHRPAPEARPPPCRRLADAPEQLRCNTRAAGRATRRNSRPTPSHRAVRCRRPGVSQATSGPECIGANSCSNELARPDAACSGWRSTAAAQLAARAWVRRRAERNGRLAAPFLMREARVAYHCAPAEAAAQPRSPTDPLRSPSCDPRCSRARGRSIIRGSPSRVRAGRVAVVAELSHVTEYRGRIAVPPIAAPTFLAEPSGRPIDPRPRTLAPLRPSTHWVRELAGHHGAAAKFVRIRADALDASAAPAGRAPFHLRRCHALPG